MASSSSSSSQSSSSSSTTFKCPHGMQVADIVNGTSVRFNKVISNNDLFFMFDSLKDAAFPLIVGEGVFFKQFDVSTTDWTASGGVYWYEVAHYFDNRYPQVIAW